MQRAHAEYEAKLAVERGIASRVKEEQNVRLKNAEDDARAAKRTQDRYDEEEVKRRLVDMETRLIAAETRAREAECRERAAGCTEKSVCKACFHPFRDISP